MAPVSLVLDSNDSIYIGDEFQIDKLTYISGLTYRMTAIAGNRGKWEYQPCLFCFLFSLFP